MFDEITYPFSNFNCATVEVCEWMSNFIKHFTEHVVTYPCWDLIQSMPWNLFDRPSIHDDVIKKKSALLALCAGNSTVTGEFPAHRPVTRSFDVFYDLRLNQWLSIQSWCWLFETPSCTLWRHCDAKSLTHYLLNCLGKHIGLGLTCLNAMTADDLA